jgi:hypothetical protein
MISILMAFSSNTIKIRFVPVSIKKKLKSVAVKFQAEVGYWAPTNYLQDYKIYGIVIKMFIPESVSNLPQPPKDNLKI